MANISHSLKKALLTDFKPGGQADYYLLATILLVISIPAGYAVSNIALGVFTVAAFTGIKRHNINPLPVLCLPILLFTLMGASIFWSVDAARSAKAITKYLPLVVIPLCFILNPPGVRHKVIITKYYSIAMAGYAAYYIARASVRYISTGNSDVFFYHELCTNDVNAIHVSLYMSVAFFYFLSKPVKTKGHYLGVAFLGLIILLLSSKSLIVVIAALVCFYILSYSGYTARVKFILFCSAVFLLAASVMAVPKIKERFMIEASTMFTGNTINSSIGSSGAQVYNLSLDQALHETRFSHDQYFPGVALRVFQARLFFEMAAEDNIWLTGYGVNAAQDKIRQKVNGYNLYPGYGEFNFHNQYIQNWAELGIAGLLILLAMLFINLSHRCEPRNPAAPVINILFISYLFHNALGFLPCLISSKTL